MKHTHKLIGLTAILVLLLPVFGQQTQQQQTQQQQQQAEQTTPTVDELFIITTAQGDTYEVNSSQLALERAESDEVRNFAQRMVDDHTASSAELAEVAQQVGVSIEMMLSPMHQLMIEELTALEGEAFEAAYLRQQRLAHETAVALFEIAVEMAEDEAVRSFAEEHLPTIQEHLEMVLSLLGEEAH